MRKRAFSIVMLVLFAVGIAGLTAGLNAFTTWGTKYGSSHIPVAMYADQNLNPYIQGEAGSMRRGGRTWNNVSTSYFSFYFAGWYSGGVPVNDDKNQNKYAYLDPYVLGETWLVTNNSNRECDTNFDMDTNWNTGPGPTGWNQIDLESVCAHEFGHNLGLGHSSYQQATMYYAINYGDDSKRTLYSDDINGIDYLYPAGPNAPSVENGGSNSAFVLDADASMGNGVRALLRLSEPTDVQMKIYSEDGALVETLADGYLQAGDHAYKWEPEGVDTGVYFIAFNSDLGHTARRLFVLK
jgi:hypothetical protein